MEIDSVQLSPRERRAANQQRRRQKSIERAAAANSRVRSESTISSIGSSRPSPFLRQALENQTRIACESQTDEMEWSSTPSDSQEDGMQEDIIADRDSLYPPINSIFPSYSAPLGTSPFSTAPPSPSPSSSSSSTTYSSQSSPTRHRPHVIPRLEFLASRQLPRPKGPNWKTKPGQGLRNYALVQPSDPWLYAYSSRSGKNGAADMFDAPWHDDEQGVDNEEEWCTEDEEYDEGEWWTG